MTTTTVCDECQREVDDNGVTFVNPEKVQNYHKDNLEDSDITLHFCSECLADMTGGEVQPPHIERAKEWTQHSWDNDTYGIERLIDKLDRHKSSSFWLLLIGVGLALVIAALSLAFTIPAWVYIYHSAGGLLAVLALHTEAKTLVYKYEQIEEAVYDR